MSEHETWLVRTWLGNDEHDYNHACSLVEDAGNVQDGAEAIKQWIEEDVDILAEQGAGGLLIDLIGSALRDVDWEDVARAFKPDEWGKADEAPKEDEDDE